MNGISIRHCFRIDNSAKKLFENVTKYKCFEFFIFHLIKRGINPVHMQNNQRYLHHWGTRQSAHSNYCSNTISVLCYGLISYIVLILPAYFSFPPLSSTLLFSFCLYLTFYFLLLITCLWACAQGSVRVSVEFCGVI